jgi:hypothetical protein
MAALCFGTTFVRDGGYNDCPNTPRWQATIHDTTAGPLQCPRVVLACENHKRHLESFHHLDIDFVRLP